jgi:hypothetical protein
MDWNYIFISSIILFAGAGAGVVVATVIIFIIGMFLSMIFTLIADLFLCNK